MLGPLPIFVLIAAILFSNTISTVTGFGTAILALPLCSLILGVHTAVPLVALMSMVSATYMTLRFHSHVQRRELSKILLWGAIGFPIGNIAYHYLPMRDLKLAAGVFIILV